MSIVHEWVAIRPGLEMSRDALMVDGIRINVTPVQAREWATKLGGRLPIPAELDARWAIAPIKNSPHTYPGDLPKYGKPHSQAIDVDVAASSGGIVGNAGKHWVEWPMPAGRRALYGWHIDSPATTWRGTAIWPSESLPGTKVIQRPWDSNHNDTHTGYSMTGVFSRDVTPRRDTVPQMSAAEPTPTTRGQRGAAVVAWQTWLASGGYDPGTVDGVHGARTEAATARWRSDTPTQPEILRYPLIQAKNFTYANRKPGDVHHITLHSIQCPPKAGFARSNAKWFAGLTAPNASIHYWAGPDEVICGLEPRHHAWGAKSGPERHAQRHAIHIEHTGYTADPGRGQAQTNWLAHPELLASSARLVAGLVRDWDLLPEQGSVGRLIQWRDAMRKGDVAGAWALRSINMHSHWTDAYSVVGGHRDVGGWPWDEWLAEVRAKK